MALARRSGPSSEHSAVTNESDVRQFLTAQVDGVTDVAASALSYRHDWGELAGLCQLYLGWAAITAQSRVFVALAEKLVGGRDTGNFIASANFRLFDVAPAEGGIAVRVNVDADHPIHLVTDYLAINA